MCSVLERGTLGDMTVKSDNIPMMSLCWLATKKQRAEGSWVLCFLKGESVQVSRGHLR